MSDRGLCNRIKKGGRSLYNEKNIFFPDAITIHKAYENKSKREKQRKQQRKVIMMYVHS